MVKHSICQSAKVTGIAGRTGVFLCIACIDSAVNGDDADNADHLHDTDSAQNKVIGMGCVIQKSDNGSRECADD